LFVKFTQRSSGRRLAFTFLVNDRFPVRNTTLFNTRGILTMNLNMTLGTSSASRPRSRGSGQRLSFDPDGFTPEQAGAAIRAGAASVLSDLTGIVISLDR
jgi:hypothetical protein